MSRPLNDVLIYNTVENDGKGSIRKVVEDSEDGLKFVSPGNKSVLAPDGTVVALVQFTMDTEILNAVFKYRKGDQKATLTPLDEVEKVIAE